MIEGKTVLFTGLSGAGKTTLAQALRDHLVQQKELTPCFLDGDIIREQLCSDLGFSQEDRSKNIKRATFVASQVTQVGGLCICSFIAPYEKDREYIRTQIESYGKFFEIYVNTPLSVCEDRDIKGLYAKARSGIIKNFTGIDDPYEAPKNPDLNIDTSQDTIESSLKRILNLILS